MALLVITLVSLAVAVGMSVVAWRLAGEERRRSEARVAALAADLYDEAPSPVEVNDLFVTEARPETHRNLFNALAIGVLVVGSLIALAVIFTGGPRTSPSTAGTSGAPTAAPLQTAPPESAPLELMALGHEREGDRLVVRGVVRNPIQGAAVRDLTAVVSVFGRQGGIVGNARAPIDSAGLAAGVESGFVVRLTGVEDVSRYRVSFRIGDRAIAHVDRRDHLATVQLP